MASNGELELPILKTCSTVLREQQWGEGDEGEAFDLRTFGALLRANPPRTSNTVRELTVDAGKDGEYVVLNQYTLAASDGGGYGTAVHTVTGCPASCLVSASTWMSGSLDPADVAGETAAATMISHFWPGGVGPVALGGQHDNFALRYSGEFVFEADLYQFWASSDDGSRVYVDDNLVLDR